MSYISFSSGQGEVLIGGRERARMGVLVDELAWVMESRGRPITDPIIRRRDELEWRYRDDNFGERLGWVCLIGDDVTKLLAHVHGQCEIHGWVHPDDGDWFADLVKRAAARGLLNEDRVGKYGTWDQVADLARRSTTPLVSAYSACESWPNPYLIASERPDLFNPEGPLVDPDDSLYEAWNDLGAEEQGRIADEAIETIGPRWHPAEWGTHWSAKVTGRNPWAENA